MFRHIFLIFSVAQAGSGQLHNFWTRLGNCNAEITEEKAYESMESGVPKYCTVKIDMPKNQLIALSFGNLEEYCGGDGTRDYDSTKLRILDTSTNETVFPCVMDKERYYNGGDSPLILRYLSHRDTFLLSVRFIERNVECDQRVDFIQFGVILSLHSRGRMDCPIYLPGRSTVEVIGMSYPENDCTHSFKVKTGDHAAIMTRRTPAICSLEDLKGKVNFDILCNAGQVDLASTTGDDFELQVIIREIAEKKRNSPIENYRAIKYCQA